MNPGIPQILPASHVDLLDRPLPTVLTTLMPDGRLQSTVVWCDRDAGDVLINTMREFQKARNLRARPHATVLVMEPSDATRWIEVRAAVLPDSRDPVAHLDALARTHTGTGPYFGAVVPARLREVEHPIVYRLVPVVVRTGPMSVPGGLSRPGTPAASQTPRACPAEPEIPPSHRDLLLRPVTVALSTRMPDGTAQTQPVWCSLDGNDVLVNTTRQRRKGRNLAADPRATVLAVDPDDSGRWIELRCDVELDESGEQRQAETRVIARLHPRRICCDAIHR